MTAPMRLEVAEALNAAADLIETGWTQGQLHARIDDTDCYCLTGALQLVTGLAHHSPDTGIFVSLFLADKGRSRLFLAATDTISRHLGTGAPLPSWNDTPGRTGPEVSTALRAAAAAITVDSLNSLNQQPKEPP